MMNDIPQPIVQTTLQRILLGCLLGLLIGCPTGALGLLAWALLREPFFLISIGFGFLGMLYTPLIGGVAGSLIGCVLGGVLVILRSYHHCGLRAEHSRHERRR
jgi:hypothetical protein